MAFTNKGLQLKVKDFVFTLTWPWFWGKGIYYIRVMDQEYYFHTFFEVVQYSLSVEHLATKSTRLLGLSWEEVLAFLLRTHPDYSKGFILVLEDIDISQKSSNFWSSMPLEDTRKFTKDLVVLRCKNLQETEKLFHSISRGFAKASVYLNGSLIYTNEDI